MNVLGWDFYALEEITLRGIRSPRCRILDSDRMFAELVADVAVCRRCGLSESARNRVNGEGDLCSRVVFVGEAPGRREDESGRPFVGSAGKVMDRLLVGAGLSRDQYIHLECCAVQTTEKQETEGERRSRRARSTWRGFWGS